MRYAVFPFGMDYHLPHRRYACIPHYNLKRLHQVLMRDKDYAREGVVVRGYFTSAGTAHDRPTVLEVLGAPRGCGTDDVYIDHRALDDAEVDDAAAISREARLSVAGRPAAGRESPVRGS